MAAQAKVRYTVRCNHNRRHQWETDEPIKIRRVNSTLGRVVTPLVCPICGLYDAHWVDMEDPEGR